MVVREIAPLNFVVCGAPAYLAKHGVPGTPADLAKHNCLRLSGASPAARSRNWPLGSDKLAAAQRISGNFLASDLTTLVTAAVHGQGLVFAPLPLVLPLFRTLAAPHPVLPECISPLARIFIHYPNRRHLPARVKAFVNFMLEQLRRHCDLTSDPQTLVAPFLPQKSSSRITHPRDPGGSSREDMTLSDDRPLLHTEPSPRKGRQREAASNKR